MSARQEAERQLEWLGQEPQIGDDGGVVAEMAIANATLALADEVRKLREQQATLIDRPEGNGYLRVDAGRTGS